METSTKISRGNAKLGKIPNISLPPIKACGNSEGCQKDCYALKSYRMYKEVRNAWDSNLRVATENRGQYFADIADYIGKKKPRFFRWHVAGDIIDQDYLDDMATVAGDSPDTSFVAFTKMYELDFSNLPDNLTIIISAWPGKPLRNPYGLPVAYMQDGTETRVSNAVECPGSCEECGACFDLARIGKNVVFHKH
jgi:hypothetical protein